MTHFVRSSLTRIVLVCAALIFFSGRDAAQSVVIVNPATINHWLDLAQQIRNLGFCRYSPSDPALSLDRNVQVNFARGVNDDTIAKRTAELEGTLKRCSFCRVYAKAAVSASRDNISYKCGFTGPLWSTDEAYHFDGCMTVEHNYSGNLFSDLAQVGNTSTLEELEAEYMNPDTGARTQAIAECKLTHRGPVCFTCHNVSSVSVTPKESSSAAFPSRRKSTREKPDQLITNRPAVNVRKNSSNSRNDLVRPSGRSGRRATPSKGNNTSAMDRLSGDNQLPNSGRPSSIFGEGNRRVPARGGGASTVAKPVINTPAPSPTGDFGNCASCGRPPASPR